MGLRRLARVRKLASPDVKFHLKYTGSSRLDKPSGFSHAAFCIGTLSYSMPRPASLPCSKVGTTNTVYSVFGSI